MLPTHEEHLKGCRTCQQSHACATMEKIQKFEAEVRNAPDLDISAPKTTIEPEPESLKEEGKAITVVINEGGQVAEDL